MDLEGDSHITIGDKLKAAADRIDPETDGVVILIVGDAEIMLGITATGNTPFDAHRLATGLDVAVKRDHVTMT